MNEEKRGKNDNVTGHVLENLLNSKDFEQFTNLNQEDFVEESFGEYLEQLAESKGITKSDMIRDSGIERTYAYQMIRGLRNPNRDKVLMFAIGLKLDYEETQKLLRVSHHSALYPRIKRDAAIIFCLSRNLSFTEVQEMLSRIGEIPLS